MNSINKQVRKTVDFLNNKIHMIFVFNPLMVIDAMAVFSSPAERAMVDGRIGPTTVGWDTWGKFGKCMIDPVTGRFYSTTNFSSVRTNTCVCKGTL